MDYAMSLKRKDIVRSGWQRVIRRTDKYYLYDDRIVGYLRMLEVTTPLYKNYRYEAICIADTNYTWFQIGLKDKHYWITAMYDNHDTLVQIYFDVSNYNYVSYDAYFEDLYLDVVLLPNNEIYILDEDELEEAYINHDITDEQYILAKNTCEEIVDMCTKNSCGIINYVNEEYRKLKEDVYENY
ncbi:MAG: DUF402 domain-containing protein [Erysipelotrichales bacterium]|nr:DUF402 domain-containing protein [Erysipelotrichales bacterium]